MWIEGPMLYVFVYRERLGICSNWDVSKYTGGLRVWGNWAP